MGASGRTVVEPFQSGNNQGPRPLNLLTGRVWLDPIRQAHSLRAYYLNIRDVSGVTKLPPDYSFAVLSMERAS